MYVIQWRTYEWDSWATLPQKYATLAEVKAAFGGRVQGKYNRIAEEYTVVRYKAVKEAGQ